MRTKYIVCGATLLLAAAAGQAGTVAGHKPASHPPHVKPVAFHAKPPAHASHYTPERYRPLAMLKARADFDKAHGLRFEKIIRGNAYKRQIALTFDDGPHDGSTLELLAVLKQMHAPATFFVVGRQVEKFPELLRKEVAEGYEIGNHTFDHLDLTEIPPELIGYELDQCDRVVKRVAGVKMRFFRPPGGNYDNDVIRETTRLKYVTALWTDDPADYERLPGDIILKRCLDHLENGAILLLHDGVPETVAILPELITEARNEGYEFVTMSTLMKARGGSNQRDIEPKIKHAGTRMSGNGL